MLDGPFFYFLVQTVEIQVKEGGTGLHKTVREINLVYNGLMVGKGAKI